MAFTALAILELDTFRFKTGSLLKTFEFLKSFFWNEFVLSSETTDQQFIQNSITAFLKDNMMSPRQGEPDTCDLTPEGLKKLKLFASFLAPYFESYLVVLDYLRQKEAAKEAAEAPEEKEEMKHLLVHGKKMFKNNEIERLEAVSKLTLQNAYHFFMDQQVIAGEDRTKADFYEDRIHTYLMLIA
jgi:glycerol-3-phosphate O-acyltransferase